MSQSASTALAEFALSRDESAFRRVVDEFGGLVLQAARRRTGDHQLAEEVAQNVFAIMARKAGRVAKHPSISGWVFTTTRLESAKALRGRQRHLRKLDALTEELKATHDMNDDDLEQWRDALPLLEAGLDQLGDAERAALLARFFEGKNFQEIAKEAGKSESACKMRVRRSLDKLNGWMVRRGVVLSVVTLGSALSAEWAKAAPATVSASLSAKAVAAAPAIGASTILTNTLITMNTTKSTAVAAAAVLAASAVPLAMQHSKATELKQEVAALHVESSALPTRSRSLSALTSAASGNGKMTPAQRFLAKSKIPDDPKEFLNALMSAAMEQNMVGMMRVVLPVSKMETAELEALIAEFTEGDDPLGKQVAVPILMGFLDQDGDPPALLDRALNAGVPIAPLVGKLVEWAMAEPAAALAWYRRSREAHAFEGKGVGDSQEIYVLMGLLPALAQSDPDSTMEVLEGADHDVRNMLRGQVVGAFFTQGEEGLARGREVLLATDDVKMRLMAFTQAVKHSGGANPEGMAEIVGSLGFDGEQEATALAAIAGAAEGSGQQ